MKNFTLLTAAICCLLILSCKKDDDNTTAGGPTGPQYCHCQLTSEQRLDTLGNVITEKVAYLTGNRIDSIEELVQNMLRTKIVYAYLPNNVRRISTYNYFNGEGQLSSYYEENLDDDGNIVKRVDFSVRGDSIFMYVPEYRCDFISPSGKKFCQYTSILKYKYHTGIKEFVRQNTVYYHYTGNRLDSITNSILKGGDRYYTYTDTYTRTAFNGQIVETVDDFNNVLEQKSYDANGKYWGKFIYTFNCW